MTEPRTHTLEVPGATLTYDVRRSDPSGERILLLIGSPLGAAGFTTLSRHFMDRTVVTYDPPGSERSVRTDGAAQSTPDEHADDLHRLISALDAGPVDIFHHPRHSLRAGLRRPSRGIDPHRPRCRGRVRRRAAQRGAHAVAERLGKSPMTFPSNHGGFLGGEYGQTGDPDAFAVTLRDILTER